ncbi:MAG: SAM-dependent chlorinase/fluorinase [Deltaproteobacteria bacterium]|nr:SAM-dependent chlorinase/fluorinase [Deltaproteobacteria bacterium]
MSAKRKRPASASSVGGGTRPVVTLLTDFGERDGFVGIVKGVLFGICPEAHVVDLTHEVVPQDVTGGALVLASAVGYFPRRTIHLAVVDPGVGTSRRPILIDTEDFVLVGPDNGLLSLASDRSAVRRVVHLDRAQYFLASPTRTFHARDVFAPVAAHCARGTDPGEMGSPMDGFQRLSLPRPRRVDDGLEGQVIHVDRFGNLICNIGPADLGDFRASGLSISICGVQISEISPHYSSVREGKPLAVWNSWGQLEVAVRNGSAARQLRARSGDRVQVKLRR